MMKNRTLREKIIIATLFVGVVSYLLYSYYIMPTIEDLNTVNENITTLEAETANYEAKTTDLENKKVEVEKQNTTINSYKNTEASFAMNSYNLLAYMGPVAEKNNVSVTLFKELEKEEHEHYINSPYHIVIQGDYTNLLNVMESLGEIDYNYTISEYNMKVIDVDPKTNKPMEETAEKSEYKWTSGNNTYVTGQFPLFRVEEEVDDNDESVSEEEKDEDDKLDFTPIKKVQIEFKLNFVLFREQQVKDTKQEVDVKTGKDDPFYSKVLEQAKEVAEESKTDYLGEDIKTLSDANRALFMSDKSKLQEEIDKVLLAIYNREQKEMDTSTQMSYLKELLSIQEGTESPTISNSNDTSSSNGEERSTDELVEEEQETDTIVQDASPENIVEGVDNKTEENK